MNAPSTDYTVRIKQYEERFKSPYISGEKFTVHMFGWTYVAIVDAYGSFTVYRGPDHMSSKNIILNGEPIVKESEARELFGMLGMLGMLEYWVV